MKPIEECAGYKKLMASFERDIQGLRNDNWKDSFAKERKDKVKWALERAKHYAEKTGLEAADILDAWEEERTYWFMNFYQEANQPEIKGNNVRVFETIDSLKESIGSKGFRCPSCKCISKNPYECDSGNEKCDWKSYGLFGCLDHGVTVFVKAKMKIETFFMPIAWENKE